MFQRVNKIISLIKEIQSLPKVKIAFKGSNAKSIDNYKKIYQYFTKPHRFKLFKNKTIGVALIDLNQYSSFEEYYKSINGKNSAAYYARKATKRGYRFLEIDRNNYIDDIYTINTSATVRQGKQMSSGYLKKQESYTHDANYRYFGVVDSDGRLLAYCNIAFFGEFSLVSALLGHKKYLNDGIMYLMLVEFMKIMFYDYKPKGYRYIMYDTFFGASDGLKMFKKKLGFTPYKVAWKWES